MSDQPTLRRTRNEALDKLAIVITAEWGRRCDRFETGCASCIAWAVFDMMEKITDGSALDDPDEYKRIMSDYDRWEGKAADAAQST